MLSGINLKAATAHELYPLVHLIGEHCRKQEYDTVSTILEQLNLELCSTIVLMSVMRTSYAYSNHIPIWKDMLHRVCDEINYRGEDGPHVLRGLFVAYNNPFSALFPGVFDNEHLPSKGDLC